MPKERLLDEYGSAFAQVTWSPEQHVQLAVLNSNSETFIAWCRGIVEEADKVTAELENAKRRGITIEPRAYEPGHLSDGTSMGMFWTPNRYQINQLIRVLRRARNAAYGADE